MSWNRIKRKKLFNLYLCIQYMFRNRVYILCFHLMIILSRSYGTEGLSGNSTYWDTPHHHAVQQTSLRIKQPRSSSEAKRSWPLLYTSKWWSSLAVLRPQSRIPHERDREILSKGRTFYRVLARQKLLIFSVVYFKGNHVQCSELSKIRYPRRSES
jgi:hypothetical protein